MGRPIECPWTVQWYHFDDFSARLCYVGKLVLLAKPPEMLAALHGSPIMTSDLEHLLRWASFIHSEFVRNMDGQIDVTKRVRHLRDEIDINSIRGKEMTYQHVSRFPPPDVLQLIPMEQYHHFWSEFLEKNRN